MQLRFFGIISYIGKEFYGWQKQGPVDQVSIHSTLVKVLERILQETNIKIISPSRTDRGVHAFEHGVLIEINKQFESSSLLKAMNALLPSSVRVKELRLLKDNSLPFDRLISKTYCYYFRDSAANSVYSPVLNDFIVELKPSLNISLMQKACEALVGEHDFFHFMTRGTPVKSTIRKIYSCGIERIESSNPHSLIKDTYYVFYIEGNGFLKQMVRLLMGTLWNIGQEKVTIQALKGAIKPSLQKEKFHHRLGPVAPAKGLFLNKMNFLLSQP